jgi:dTDP-4-amino-4,6-dideoxygalactose transaminase
LSAKLPHLDRYNRDRYDLACRYTRALEGIGDLVLPEIPEPGSHVFHLYVIRTKRRQELLGYLNNEGIGAGIHYPTPVHLHGAFTDLGYQRGTFPYTEAIADEILSLPLYPELSNDQLEYVAGKIRAFFDQG